MEENTPKTAPAMWEEKFGDSGDLSLSPVRVGAGGLKYMAVTVCFDRLATACWRLLSETAFLSLGVTRCYFFPYC